MPIVRTLLLPALLAACSPSGDPPQDPAAAATPIAIEQAHATVAAEGKGFTVGALMAAQTVCVLFDPQCPHCGHLWNALLQLQSKARLV